MRSRISFGLIVPSLSHVWTTFSSDSEKENVLPPPYFNGECGKWNENWDGRSPEGLVKTPKRSKYLDLEEYSKSVEQKRSRANRNIILIRHGQYHVNAENEPERKLTDKGREQACATGRRLVELRRSEIMPFSRLVSSTLTRAVETADLISKELTDETHPALPRTYDPLLCEGSPCKADPTTFWRPESKFLEDGSRIEAAFRRYFHRASPEQVHDSYEIIACHANVIRYFVCRALQFPPQGWLRMSLAHGSITWIVIRYDGRVILRCFGDAGHMQPELITR